MGGNKNLLTFSHIFSTKMYIFGDRVMPDSGLKGHVTSHKNMCNIFPMREENPRYKTACVPNDKMSLPQG